MLRSVVKPEDAAKEEKSVAEHVSLQQWYLDIDPRQLRWESYVKAGYYGVLERFFTPDSASVQYVYFKKEI